jgi:hypothetical protein
MANCLTASIVNTWCWLSCGCSVVAISIPPAAFAELRQQSKQEVKAQAGMAAAWQESVTGDHTACCAQCLAVNTTLGPSLTLANMCASRVHLTPNGFWLATPFALRLPLDPTLVLTGAPNVTPLNTTFTLTNVTAVGSRSDVMALIYLYTIWRTSFAPPGGFSLEPQV